MTLPLPGLKWQASSIALLIFILFASPLRAQQALFTAPDTVCVNDPINISHVSNATSYFWNFCSGGFYSMPTVDNLGNPGGALSQPVFMVTAKEGGNFYGFITNNDGKLVKLNFGNSLLNTPSAVDWGSVGGVVPNHTEGLQLVQDGTGWHVLVVGGVNETLPQIVRIDLGTTLASNAEPTGISWGNIGTLDYPTDLYVFQSGNRWYGFVTNWNNNTITRFDFGTDFSQTPVGTNLGNLGGLTNPTGICALQENGNWYVCVINEMDGTLTRLDFGSSLLNAPVATNMGNPGGVVKRPRDLTVIHDCGGTFGLVTNGPPYHELVKINFDGGITGTVHGNDLGNIGNFSFPHSISTLFREGQNLYSFITNVSNQTLSRVVFSSCNASSIPSSMAAAPPSFSYNTPGIYTVNLQVDETLPSQSTYCKNIVVLNPPVAPTGISKTVCPGATFTFDAAVGASTDITHYTWDNGTTTAKLTAGAGQYTVTVSNGGCTATSTPYKVDEYTALSLGNTVTPAICKYGTGSINLSGSGGFPAYHYSIDGITQPDDQTLFSGLAPGTYRARLSDDAGCKSAATDIVVNADATKNLATSGTATSPVCASDNDGAIAIAITSGPGPYAYAIDGGVPQASGNFTPVAAGKHQVITSNAYCKDTVQATIIVPDAIAVRALADEDACDMGVGKVSWTPQGGTPPYAVLWDNAPIVPDGISGLHAGSYPLHLEDAKGCYTDTIIVVKNNNIPRVNIITPDTVVNIGEPVPILVENNAPDYRWTPASGLDCDICGSTTATPLQPMTYIVETVTGKNCIKSDTIHIDLTYNEHLIVPNAFSPNGDGLNDTFRPNALGLAAYHLSIFNRWGQLIFESQSTKLGWDGTFKGLAQTNSAFVYVIDYAFYSQPEKKLQRKGTVTLIR